MTNCIITIVFHSSQAARERGIRKNGVRIFLSRLLQLPHAVKSAPFACAMAGPLRLLLVVVGLLVGKKAGR